MQAGAQNIRKYSNDFLTIGAGARAFALSGSVTSLVDDATAGYWNPAALTKIDDNIQATFMHAAYFGGIANYDYGSIAFGGKKNSGYALSFVRMGVDGILNTINLIENGEINYSRVSSFSAVDFALIGSMGQKIKLRGYRHIDFAYGVNTKIIRRRGGQFAKAWGFGIDLSINYTTGKWKFAGVVRDVTTTVNAWNYSIDEATREVFVRTGNEIPENSTELTIPRIILGGSREFKISDKFEAIAEMNLDVTLDGKRNTFIRSNAASVSPSLGVELGYKKIVFLRTGINNVQWIQQFNGTENLSLMPNVGVGVKFKKFAIDYALSNIGNQSLALYSNVFSLRYSF